MTRVVLVRSVCHCEKDDRTTRQSIVSRGTRVGWRFAYWLTGAVDDKGEGVSGAKIKK